MMLQIDSDLVRQGIGDLETAIETYGCEYAAANARWAKTQADVMELVGIQGDQISASRMKIAEGLKLPVRDSRRWLGNESLVILAKTALTDNLKVA